VRKELDGRSLDAGPHTIARHLERHHGLRVSPTTAHWCLAREAVLSFGERHDDGSLGTAGCIQRSIIIVWPRRMDVPAAFRRARAAHGAPAATLAGNGLVFTTRLLPPGAGNALEQEPARLGTTRKNGRHAATTVLFISTGPAHDDARLQEGAPRAGGSLFTCHATYIA
jgi:hypothetical protein